MAYYDNAPSHKPQGKKSFGREKWVEEGSEYRGARHGGRPSGKRDDNRALIIGQIIVHQIEPCF